MPDIGSSSFDEIDANNDEASPDGFPEGMAPSGLNNSARAVMGAVKRSWKHINPVLTTGGTSSAYTLSFDQAPAAYVDGELYSFVVNAANAVDATLNVNALGAIPLRLFAGNLLAGALQADQIVQARYNSAAGAFDIISQNGWVRIGERDPSGAATVDFTSIPAGVKHLQCMFGLTVSTDGARVFIQTHGADGVLDTGASDYYWTATIISTTPGTNVNSSTASSISLSNGSVVDNSTDGFSGDFTVANIQAATFTKFQLRSAYLDSAGALGISFSGVGVRQESDRITGFRIGVSSGTITGKATLFGSA